MGTRPELPDYLDIEGDEDYDEVLGDQLLIMISLLCSFCLMSYEFPYFIFDFTGIFYACTMEDPNKRPSARKLVEILEENEENNKVVSSFGDQ